ncbi:hypothetical protein ACFS7Z_10325 [Pontibacter toksunensis]|uniref:Outer membrane protein beta-barrel domain-containing protein n=1 Tax=Pontibacter toksunensis TaxID=1332631 RepID=A0ABW6BUX6_9BACT
MPYFKPKALSTLSLLLFLLPCQLFAQEFTQNFKAFSAFYVEVGGNSDVYSFNYDRVLYQREKFKTAARVGLGTNLFFLEDEKTLYPVMPLELMALVGNNRKHFEGGLGYTRRLTDDPDLLQSMYFARLGFRYQVPRGGLLVRVAFTPFISPDKESRTPGVGVIPRFGFSVGKSFR